MQDKEQLGYLTAMVETILKNQEEFKSGHKILQDRIQHIEDELSIYKTIYKTVKWIGMSLIALATFKWASLVDIWHIFRGQ